MSVDCKILTGVLPGLNYNHSIDWIVCGSIDWNIDWSIVGIMDWCVVWSIDSGVLKGILAGKHRVDISIDSMECWLEYQPFPVYVHSAGNTPVNTPTVRTPQYNMLFQTIFVCSFWAIGLFPVNLKN